MIHNRITRLADYSNVFATATHPTAIAVGSASYGSQGSANVMVPWTTLAGWQQELYRMAYEQALVDTARPRHERLIAWN